MTITCDRILVPDFEDETLNAVAEQRAKRVKCVFDMGDVAMFNEYRHSGRKLLQVFFYYQYPIIIDYSFDEFEKKYNEEREEEENKGFQYWIPAN